MCALPHCRRASTLKRDLHAPVLCAARRRCQTVGGVSPWWRQVSLEANLLPDLNLNCLPLFAQVRQLQGRNLLSGAVGLKPCMCRRWQ